MAMIGVSVADIIKAARGLVGAEKTKQVTNDQLGEWATAGLGALYDAVIQADESYFSLSADLVFGSGTEAAATQPLPDDFYHMRGVKQWPDTARQRPIFPVTETDSSRKPGYILRGGNMQITPPWAPMVGGPYRISYAPLPPKFGRVINTSVAADDGIIDGASIGLAVAIQARNGNFTFQDDVNVSGCKLYLYNSVNDCRNIIGSFPDGGIPVDWANGAGRELIGLTQITSVPVIETFAPDTVAVLVHDGEIVTLDPVLAPYRHYIECFVAAKILEKKKQSRAGMDADMQAEIARFVKALPDRESEPEAAPVLWRPRGFQGRGDGIY